MWLVKFGLQFSPQFFSITYLIIKINSCVVVFTDSFNRWIFSTNLEFLSEMLESKLVILVKKCYKIKNISVSTRRLKVINLCYSFQQFLLFKKKTKKKTTHSFLRLQTSETNIKSKFNNIKQADWSLPVWVIESSKAEQEMFTREEFAFELRLGKGSEHEERPIKRLA